MLNTSLNFIENENSRHRRQIRITSVQLSKWSHCVSLITVMFFKCFYSENYRF